jgi:cytochrome P450
MFFSKRRSWLDGLYVRSYSMKMGEVHLPGVDLYMVNEPSLVRQVMVDESAAFPKHKVLGDALRPLLGDSIFTTNGSVWQRQRSLMNPSFEAARVKKVYARMQDAAQSMLERLDLVSDGEEHDMEVEMTHVAADIILRTILSQPLDGEGARRIFEAFERYQALATQLMMPAFFGLRWFKPWWSASRSRRAAEEIRGLLITMIQPRFDAFHRSAGSSVGDLAPDQDDILATLLRVRDPTSGEGFTFDELVDQVAMLFLAGHETSASALAWALYLMANAPEVQERMFSEATSAWAAVREEPAGLRDMPLTRNVFRETLRLFPPVGFFARESAQARVMRGKKVAAGASVLISPWLIQRHRDLWARPDEFDPDRYDLDEEAIGPCARDSLKQAYLPFGMGPRVCIGAAFALQEASLVLASLTRHYRFEPVDGHVPEPVGRLTVRAQNGIRLRVYKRSKPS